MPNAKGGPLFGGRKPGIRLDGDTIRRIRIRTYTLDAVALAKKCEIHKSTIVRAEAGLPVSEVTAARIAIALGVDIEDLLPRTPAGLAG